MPQASNITINDGSATPVAVTFSVERKDPTLTSWVDRRLAVASVQPRVTVGFSPANPKRKTDRVPVTITVPITGMRDGLVVPIGANRFIGEFIISEDSPEQSRKDIVAFTINALQNALIKGVPLSRDPIY